MKYIKVALTFFLLAIAPAFVLGQHSHSTKGTPQQSVITGLGDVNFKVSTRNPEAQEFFNQGLACIYGFNHEESLRAFRHAAELDPQLAMAYWGVALALGSNYNLQADAPQLKEAYASLQRALELSSQSSEREQAYIAALAKRYSNNTDADRQKLAVDYVNAMGEVVKRFPDDLDAATLYAESMMNVRPWKLWTRDGKPAEGTLKLIAVLESVLRRNPNHIGANHYYIHAVEASPNPERAVPSAARLGKLAPKAGHLVHMPSHIYIRTGEYEQAAQANADAIVVDREYIKETGANGVYPMMYYNHNIHFLASVRAMNGRFTDSIKAARELEANVKPHLKAMPMLEMFAPYPTVTLVRFRKWDDILSTPKPDSELKITTAYWHFARGTAYAGTNEPAKAETELQAFRAVVASVPADAGIGNSAAHDVLKVAELMLAGKIALSRGDEKTGFEILTQAVKAEDAVSYNEPPDWDLPSRELLGGALLRSGDYSEAEKVFRAELVKHPRNGRALFGLAESLKGQKKNTTAKTVEVEFLNAWKTADTKMSIEILSGLPVKREAVSTQLRYADAKIKTGIRLRYAEQGNAAGRQ